MAGTPGDYQSAVMTRDAWLSYGINATIEEYPVLLQYPLFRSVSIVYPPESRYNCTLQEAVVDDETSGKPAVQYWHAMTAPGDVTGELVFVNYGREEDFEAIKHINLTGKVVIVRFGEGSRGKKVERAEHRGAVAVLHYLDPSDTGEIKAKSKNSTVYPGGPYSSNSTIQMGSVGRTDGDPMTPGWPSIGDAPRLTLEELIKGEGETIGLPKIISQPIGYGDAKVLIAGLQGNPTPAGKEADWLAGFDIKNIGPGPVQVRVKVEVNFTVTPIWNVIGTITGAVEPDRLVIVGNHRDSWSFGAVDPISGHSVMMETSKILGDSLKKGWRPRRTLLLCSWDGEEYAYIGSHEFVEKWKNILATQAITYMNMDIAVTGRDYLQVEIAPSLMGVFKRVAAEIENPILRAEAKYMGPTGGTDYVPFMYTAGVSSIGFGFWGFEYDGVYHSNYDSYYWFDKFMDPDYSYHVAATQILGTLTLVFLEELVLPFDHVDYANFLVPVLEKFTNNTPSVDFSHLKGAVSRFKATATRLKAKLDSAQPITLPPLKLRALNDILMLTERVFLSDKNMTNSWVRHTVLGESATNAYAGSTFPALGDAITEGNLARAQYMERRLSVLFDEAAVFLEQAVALFA